MIKHLTLSMALIVGAAACSEKKIEEGGEQPASEVPAGTGKGATTGSLIDKYPPDFGVFPLSQLPEPGRALNFGFDASGAKKFEMILLYAVAALPSFESAASLPDLSTEEKQAAFDKQWAQEFQGRPEYVKELADLEKQFVLTVDSSALAKADVDLTSLLKDVPDYVKITQKFKANRFTMLKVGSTAISASVNGEDQGINIPLTITAYPIASINAGQTIYTNTCATCHGDPKRPETFLLHASDSLAAASDAEIVNVFVNGQYPDGSSVNNGQHKHGVTSPDQQSQLVAYLRSLPPVIDKFQIVLDQQAAPAAFRFK